MNKHIFLDNITASLSGLLADNKKFFAKSIDSPSFEKQVAAVEIDQLSFASEGINEIKATTLVGDLDPGFMVVQWRGTNFPTLIYNHGNNERPFDFTKIAKNTFHNVIGKYKDSFDVNLIVVRAPFHNCKLSHYQEKMTELKNFVAMISTTVKLNQTLVEYLQGRSKAPVIVTGISLGGWVSNLHRAIYNSATAYIPLMAGAYLGDLFINSEYNKVTSALALNNPEQIKKVLNFDALLKTKNNQNLFPLLGRYDRFIEHRVQKESYVGYPLKTIDFGHITGALNPKVLREHIYEVLKPYNSN